MTEPPAYSTNETAPACLRRNPADFAITRVRPHTQDPLHGLVLVYLTRVVGGHLTQRVEPTFCAKPCTHRNAVSLCNTWTYR
jgi:hypothetical protein